MTYPNYTGPVVTAAMIYAKYVSGGTFAFEVDKSPEPYRAMVYECGYVDGPAIDGTEQYDAIVTELERLFCGRV